MSSVSPARADRRVLFSAALTGAGLGLAVGAVYMAGGMADAIAARGQSQQMAAAAAAGYADGGASFRQDPAPAPAEPRAALLRLAAPPKVRAGAGDLDCLTQAVYFEARGETARGQAAVAQVVLNRVRHPAFPKTVCAVVYQGCQFSFACDGSTRRAHETGAWSRARKVAARALAGTALVEVGSATHFHAVRVNPGWGPSLLRVSQVGLHVFYQLSNHPVRWAKASSPTPVEATAVLAGAPAAPDAPALVLTDAMPAPTPDKAAAPPVEALKTDAVAPATDPAAAPIEAKFVPGQVSEAPIVKAPSAS